MIGPSDEEQPNQQEESSGSADDEEEKVTPMNEHDGGPREAAQAAGHQARVRLKDGREEAAAIAGDVSSCVKLHPTAAMVIAALVGFLLGRLLK